MKDAEKEAADQKCYDRVVAEAKAARIKWKTPPQQLRLFDIRHICDRCTESFEKECSYKGCWMGWHIDGKKHPEKALCQIEERR